MPEQRAPVFIDTSITIDDTRTRETWVAKARVWVDPGSGLRLDYERFDGSSGHACVPTHAVARALDEAGVSPRPCLVKAFWCTDQDHRTFGPFTRRDTTEIVARGKGELGTDARVGEFTYVVWRDADGVLMGVQALGEPTRIRETEPKEAAIEAALSKLEPAERALLEAALAR